MIKSRQKDDYTIHFLLDYPYFKKKSYKLIAEDLSKQHVLNTDPKAIQQINSTGKLDCAGSPSMVFIFKEVK